MPLLPLVDRAGSSPFLTCVTSGGSWRAGGAGLPVSDGGWLVLREGP